MKKIILSISILSLFAVALSSCTVTMPVTVSDAKIGSKRGESTTTTLFRTLDLNKNYGVKEAASNGQITGPIATVDVRIKSYIFFSKKTMIVTAE